MMTVDEFKEELFSELGDEVSTTDSVLMMFLARHDEEDGEDDEDTSDR